MSELYAIHAFDDMYGGLHGIESYSVIEAESLKEAEEYAFECSCDIIEDYVIHEFYNDAENEGIEDEEELQEYIDECIQEDIAYEVYKVKETTESLEELDDKINQDPEDFIEKYCISL